MSIEEIGVVSNMVGSVAVVLTLFFLAYQVDRARRELARENVRDMIRHNNEILLRLSDNPDFLDTHMRAQKNFGSLTEAERMKWGTWLSPGSRRPSRDLLTASKRTFQVSTSTPIWKDLRWCFEAMAAKPRGHE
jgi:hypothetical protein